MKKLITLSCIFLLSVALAFAQDTERTLNVTDFTRLSLGSAFKIEVKQGNAFRVTVAGDRQDLDDLDYGVSRGILRIGYKNSNWRKNRQTVRVNVTMPTLNGVDFSGACVARVSGFKSERTMDIDVSGASKVEMDIIAEKVDLDLSGASRLTLIGQTGILEGELSGASAFNGKDFPARQVQLEASGASTANVMATSSLKADASGASRISYAGSAREVRSNTSGASSVRRVN
jgi:hypothetical protein